ncbi:hypothetical protein SteCoe_25884 [Stentor coeruleus]|uniref:Uncharacterized protein n=1 Tax=Stentor coeruleus TaxID=5963 RepID=A0A1R2BE82_9CILI|nr:hypothetical protein SteCoe_25884 [Stentor coeruleus]
MGKTYCQIFIHHQQLSYALMKTKSSSPLIKSFTNAILNQIIFKDVLPDNYFYDLPGFEDGIMYTSFGQHDNPIEEILNTIERETNQINTLESPVLDLMRIPMHTYNNIKSFPSFNYTCDSTLSHIILDKIERLKLEAKEWPIVLCLNLSTDNQNEILPLVIDIEQTISFSLSLVVYEDLEKNIFLFFRDQTTDIWKCINQTESNLNYDDIIKNRNFHIKYVFYDRISNPKLNLLFKKTLNSLFLNIFFNKKFYSKVITFKSKISWLEVLLKEFNRIEDLRIQRKNEEKKLEEEKAEKKEQITKNKDATKPKNFLSVQPDDFSNISEEYMKYSSIMHKRNDKNNSEIVEEFFEELHQILYKINENCECLRCEFFTTYKTREGKIRCAVDLDLGSGETYMEYVNKCWHTYESTTLKGVNKDIFAIGDILRDGFEKFMVMKLFGTTGDNEVNLKPYLIFRISRAPSFGRKFLLELEKIDIGSYIKKNEFYNISSVIYYLDSSNDNTSVSIINEQSKWYIMGDKDDKEINTYCDAISKAYGINTSIFFYTNEQPNFSIANDVFETRFMTKNIIPFISSAITILLNLPLFKKEMMNFQIKPGFEWTQNLYEMIHDKITDARIENFIKNYMKVVDMTHYEMSTSFFIDNILENIHIKSAQGQINCLCPSCRSFMISGILLKTKKEIKKRFIVQVFQNQEIKLGGNTLNKYSGCDYNYDIKNPPLCLMIKLSNMVDPNSKEFKKHLVRAYLKDNNFITYANNNSVTEYKLKSIVFAGGDKTRSLIYNKKKLCWEFVSDPEIIPISIDDINNMKIIVGAFIPESLIYTIGISDQSLSMRICSIFSALSSINYFRKRLYPNSPWAKLMNLENKSDIVPLEILRIFTTNYETFEIESIFYNILNQMHNSVEDSENTICKCIVCKLFCCKVIEGNNENNLRKIRKLGYSITSKYLMKQMNIMKSCYDMKIFKDEIKKADEAKNLNTSDYDKGKIVNIVSVYGSKIIVADFRGRFNEDDMRTKKFINETMYFSIKGHEPLFYTLNSIILHHVTKTKYLVYKVSDEYLIFSGTEIKKYTLPSTKSLKKYTPILGFYEKTPINFVKTVLKSLVSIDHFSHSIESYNIPNSEWFDKFKSFFESQDQLENPLKIIDFIKCLHKDNPNLLQIGKDNGYDCENALKDILNYIHNKSMCCKNNQCPVCKSFLIEGSCWTVDDPMKVYNIYTTNILNVVKVACVKVIKDAILSYTIDSDVTGVSYELEELPLSLIYVLNYATNNSSSIEDIIETCNDNIKVNTDITIQRAREVATYSLVCIIFHVKNNSDRCIIARSINYSSWAFGDNEYIKGYKPENSLKNIKEITKRDDYFPAILIYNKRK